MSASRIYRRGPPGTPIAAYAALRRTEDLSCFAELDVRMASRFADVSAIAMDPRMVRSLSEPPVPSRLDTPEAVAGPIRARAALCLGGRVLVANPVSERDEIPSGEIAASVKARVAEAKAGARGVSGKAVTPFLLLE